jgi:hypothetical protein
VSLVFVVVAVQAQEFPVAAIGRIVVVIMVPVMDGQLAHIPVREFPATATTDPRVDLQSPFPVPLRALVGESPCFCNDAIKSPWVSRFLHSSAMFAETSLPRLHGPLFAGFLISARFHPTLAQVRVRVTSAPSFAVVCS